MVAGPYNRGNGPLRIPADDALKQCNNTKPMIGRNTAWLKINKKFVGTHVILYVHRKLLETKTKTKKKKTVT